MLAYNLISFTHAFTGSLWVNILVWFLTLGTDSVTFLSFIKKKYSLIDSRETRKEREILTIASCMCPDQDPNQQPRQMPWPKIKPATFQIMVQCSKQLDHSCQGQSPFLNKDFPCFPQ